LALVATVADLFAAPRYFLPGSARRFADGREPQTTGMESFSKRNRERRKAERRVEKDERRKERAESKRERALMPESSPPPTAAPSAATTPEPAPAQVRQEPP
jgi:hypothetical protein